MEVPKPAQSKIPMCNIEIIGEFSLILETIFSNIMPYTHLANVSLPMIASPITKGHLTNHNKCNWNYCQILDSLRLSR